MFGEASTTKTEKPEKIHIPLHPNPMSQMAASAQMDLERVELTRFGRLFVA
jgi:hypothetical protein